MAEELDSGRLPQDPQRGPGPLEVGSAKVRGGKEEGWGKEVFFPRVCACRAHQR